MKVLELRFGDSKLLINQLIQQIRDLPDLNVDFSKIVKFATELNNAVSSLAKFSNNGGCLYRDDVVENVIGKFSRSEYDNFIRYSAQQSKSIPALVKMSKFVLKEAELNVEAGVLKQSTDSNRKRVREDERPKVKVALTTTGKSEQEVPHKIRKLAIKCVHCKSENHELENCDDFKTKNSNQRWRIAKNLRICFLCLRGGHIQGNCRANLCIHCGRKHHAVLHFEVNKNVLFLADNSDLRTIEPSCSLTDNVQAINVSDDL
ncbi:hypothetical protein TKK_0016163 [Trichogramma kaykai]|uniref:CCHC-type domain-containing protein n=1 Tax=Trichogramma kaykai TaxID=54128 RepID=A0ABD2W9R6_9HYME